MRIHIHLLAVLLSSFVSVSFAEDISHLDAKQLDEGCKSGKSKQCFVLAVMYENGRVAVRQDKAKAFYFYAKACDFGDALSCSWLGVTYENNWRGTDKENTTVAPDKFKALDFHKKGCDGNINMSCTALGVKYNNGEVVRLDKSTALRYFGKACDLKDAEGCKFYAMLKTKGVR